MPTPHIHAAQGAFAPVVLMPGDPLRAKYIAEQFLSEAVLVNSVRNMLGYTGFYKGQRVSVLGHGMGIPSIAIYATELAKFYGARVLLRVGSCGALQPDVHVRDVVVALGAGTDSNVNRTRCLGNDLPCVGDFSLACRTLAAAQRLGLRVRVGSVFSSDLFYAPNNTLTDRLTQLGVLGIEMEVAGLYGVAMEYNVRALALLTVSDHLHTGEHLSADERERSFSWMAQLALEVAKEETEELTQAAES